MHRSGTFEETGFRPALKTLHIITRFDKGGSAENTFLTAAHLDGESYEVVLVAGSMDGDPGDPEYAAVEKNVAELREKGVRLIACPHLVRELRPVADVAAFFSLCGIIRREKPKIVHTHTSKAGILGRWAAWFCRVRVIVHTPHGHVFHGYFGPVKTRLFITLERWTAKITDALVMLTPQEMKDHLALRVASPEQCTVIHSGVDLQRFNPDDFSQTLQRKLLQVPENKVIIGTVGRLTAIKGQDVLLRAFAEIAAERDDVFLVLLGEGEMRGALEETARRLKISEIVKFLGWRPDVGAVMASLDIFCLSSLNEGMGKVLVEAMAMGLPLVASDTGGIKDLVRDGENGLLVPPGDPSALAGALAYLCRNPEKRRLMGAAGRKSAPACSAAAMIAKIEILYQSLTKDSWNDF